MSDPERLNYMGYRARLIAKDLSIESMADSFVKGVLAWQSSL